MTLEDDFKAAAEKIRTLTKKPSNEDLLKLYGLFKQATEGDVNTKRPGMMDMKGKYKWDQWKAAEGKTKDEAMTEYIAEVERQMVVYAA
ncbi:unnamed protein product [Chrysoparadoxa australica]